MSEPRISTPRTSTRLRDQPSLTTSSGAIWLIVGGLFAAVSIAVLVALAPLPMGGWAAAAAIAVGILYAAMIVVRLLVMPRRRRLGMLAIGMLVMAAIAFAAVVLVSFSAWDEALSP